MQFRVNAKEFLKFIKLFKLDPSLYVLVSPNQIQVKNIDFKNFLGVIESSYKSSTNIENKIVFKVESIDLITKLENFKDQVVFQLFPVQNMIKLYDPLEPSYDYTIRGEFDKRTEKYAHISLVDHLVPGEIEFRLDSEECLNYIKIITAVENTMFFRCFKDYESQPIQLISKKITSIGNKFVDSSHVFNYNYNNNEPVFEFEVYYPNNVNLFVKECKKVGFKVLDNYLIIYNTSEGDVLDFKIHLPLREVN